MKRTILLPILTLALVLSASLSGLAAGLVNVDESGVAIMGYDPVAYFVDQKPEKGSDQFKSSYQGATYDFASAEHKALFDKAPEKYVPQFGGFCAYGVSKGHAAKVDPTAFQIIDGRLLLQYNADVLAAFNKDATGNLKQADANWPGIEKKGK